MTTTRTPVNWLIVAAYALLLAGFGFVSAITVRLGSGQDDRSLAIGIRLVLTATCLLILGRALRRAPWTIYRGPFWYAAGVIWVALIARLCWDTLIQPVPYELYWSIPQFYVFAFCVCIIPMLAFLVVPDEATITAAYWASLAALAVTGPFVIASNSSAAGPEQVWRFTPARFNSISLGHLGTSALLLAVHGLTSSAVKFSKPLVLVPGILGLGTVAIAASRGPIVALVACLALVLLTRTKPHHAVFSLLVLVVLAMAFVTTAQYVEDHYGLAALTRVRTTIEEGGEMEDRPKLFLDAFAQFARSPFVGDAMVVEPTYEYPHNVIAESFMATGLFGGVAFCATVVMAVRAAWRLLSRSPRAGWIGLLYFQYLIAAMFTGTLYGVGEMWCLAAACVAIVGRGPSARGAGFEGRPAFQGTWVGPGPGSFAAPGDRL